MNSQVLIDLINNDYFLFQTYDGLFSEFYGSETITIFPCLARAKSRGSVRLHSADPADPPLVDPNYFDHPDDMKLMIKGWDKMNTEFCSIS